MLRLEEFYIFHGQTAQFILLSGIISIVLAIPIYAYFGLYRAIFRYSGLPAMITMAKASLIYGLFFSTIFSIIGVQGIPKTIGLIQPIIVFLLVGVSRAGARIWFGSIYKNDTQKGALTNILIYGAGTAGRQLALAIANSNRMNVVGFLDDNNFLHGHVLNGLDIFNPKEIERIVILKGVSVVLLAMPSANRERRNQILSVLSNLKLSVHTIPSLIDIASGKVNLSDIKELDFEDLLGRQPVKPDLTLLNRNTRNKTVMVTGAGGSIGSELCRQVLQTNPNCLLLVEMNEFALYQIHQEILSLSKMRVFPIKEKIEVVPLLASVCDEVRMNEIVKTWRPHTIYHAAAYKHVPLVEQNHAEGVRNNVFGTKVCAEVSERNGVNNFVLISTDKAVRPTNVMGATKRLAEMVLQANNEMILKGGLLTSKEINSHNNSNTCFSIVRFGNVLGSSGSVVPLFREQIKNGGPITLTHPDITRYFMTIPEAAQLVIQAGAMGTGGDVFVLDMGEPAKIYDLAKRIVELSGLTLRNERNPHGDIEIKVTGLRPGEKLFEELLIGDDPIPTHHPRILKAHEKFVQWDELQSHLYSLNVAINANDVPMIRNVLKQLVIGYHPSSELVDCVYLAQERQNLEL